MKNLKQFSGIIALTTLLGLANSASIAGTCVAATSCPPRPVQFQPGQRLTVEIVNFTPGVLEIQRIPYTQPLTILSGETQVFDNVRVTQNNFSTLLRDLRGYPIEILINQPSPDVLRVRVRPTEGMSGDRALYIYNDGSVDVL